MYSKKTILSVYVFSFLAFMRPTLSFAYNPYIGLEYSQRSLNMAEGYGKGLFVKRLPQGNLLVGLKLNDYIGIEAGYSFSQSATRTAYSTAGDRVLGNLIPPNLLPDRFLAAENSIRLFGPHLSINAYLPIGTSPFYGIASIGFAMLALKAQFKPIGNQASIAFTPAATEKLTRHFSSKKLVNRIMGGMGYQITEQVGIRFLIGYETTSRFKNIAPKELGPLRMSLKNNTISNLGLNYSF